MSRQVVLQATDLSKSFTEGSNRLDVLRGVNLTVYAGEVVAIVGTSGSGKSTLLQCLGGLDDYDGGSVVIDGQDIGSIKEKDRTILRNHKLGFVYQFHHLLPEFTALENVAMPLRIRREPYQQASVKASEILGAMKLGDRLSHLPSQLSGGEKQRVSIARAAVGSPVCLLADEPTGNLDQETAKSVFDYLLSLARSRVMAVILVTHDLDLAAQCDRVLRLVGGRLA